MAEEKPAAEAEEDVKLLAKLLKQKKTEKKEEVSR